MTNNEILLEFLKSGKKITTRIAPDLLGIADVRANIRDLRHLGYIIKDKWITAKNRRGNITRYKEYWLGE